jgi:Fe-S cluster assembly protein SufD
MLFYLLARGIPRAEAERLLIEAFLADAIDAIGDEAIAETLKRTIGKWLRRRGGQTAAEPKERGT